MRNLRDNYMEILHNKNIKPSYSRIRVLEYLMVKKNHPTADQIYNELVSEIPTLSKTTVYNTLNLFIKSGLTRVITIEENEMRYDADVADHGHFKCESCGYVYDFWVNIECFGSEVLPGFKTNEKNVYFKGICANCLNNKKQ